MITIPSAPQQLFTPPEVQASLAKYQYTFAQLRATGIIGTQHLRAVAVMSAATAHARGIPYRGWFDSPVVVQGPWGKQFVVYFESMGIEWFTTPPAVPPAAEDLLRAKQWGSWGALSGDGTRTWSTAASAPPAKLWIPGMTDE